MQAVRTKINEKLDALNKVLAGTNTGMNIDTHHTHPVYFAFKEFLCMVT